MVAALVDSEVAAIEMVVAVEIVSVDPVMQHWHSCWHPGKGEPIDQLLFGIFFTAIHVRQVTYFEGAWGHSRHHLPQLTELLTFAANPQLSTMHTRISSSYSEREFGLPAAIRLPKPEQSPLAIRIRWPSRRFA